MKTAIAFFIVTIVGVIVYCTSLGCKPAIDAWTLSKDSLDCIMQETDNGSGTEAIAEKCIGRVSPEIIQLIIDLMAQRNAARQMGIPWHVGKADGGYDMITITHPKDCGSDK